MPFKYLTDYWRTLERLLLNSEISHILTSSAKCVIINSAGVGTSVKSDTKLHVLVVTLSTEDNARLLKQMYNYLVKTPRKSNQYFDISVYPSFKGVNRAFALRFKDATDRALQSKHNQTTAKKQAIMLWPME